MWQFARVNNELIFAACLGLFVQSTKKGKTILANASCKRVQVWKNSNSHQRIISIAVPAAAVN
jgi:hypothetical protein